MYLGDWCCLSYVTLWPPIKHLKHTTTFVLKIAPWNLNAHPGMEHHQKPFSFRSSTASVYQKTNLFCAMCNPIAFSLLSFIVTSFPRTRTNAQAHISLRHCPLCFILFAECSMWEDSAQSVRSGFTVLKESQPLFSALHWVLMTWFWLRMRRWWGKKKTHITTPVSHVSSSIIDIYWLL